MASEGLHAFYGAPIERTHVTTQVRAVRARYTLRMDTAPSTAFGRVIRRDAYAVCPFSVAIERAEAAMRRTRMRVLVVDDFTDQVRRHDALEFRWRPRAVLFPAAQALLTVRPHAPQGTELQLTISYTPPFHGFGALFDALVGRHIAWLTAGALLLVIKRELQKR
jgi:hypothetical protein